MVTVAILKNNFLCAVVAYETFVVRGHIGAFV